VRFTRRGRNFTRVFYATDVHASGRTFRKFLNAASAYEANVLVLGGDVCGKMLTPIVEGSDGTFSAAIHGEPATFPAGRLDEVVESLDTQGHYHTVLSAAEYARLESDEAAVDELFVRLARERLLDWREEAERRLAPLGVRCFVTGGNDDRPEALEALEGGDGALVFCEGRATPIDDEHVMVSCGYSNETPWHTPREVSEERLASIIDDAVSRIDDFTNVVFNFHPPPFDSTLDLCPELDTSTDPPTPVYRGGQMVYTAAGSIAVRKAIEGYRPLLGLHGHIHESRGAVNLGRSLCINPGSEYGEGYLRGCIVNLVDGKVLSYQLTSG
jgi:uncharacterized protein